MTIVKAFQFLGAAYLGLAVLVALVAGVYALLRNRPAEIHVLALAVTLGAFFLLWEATRDHDGPDSLMSFVAPPVTLLIASALVGISASGLVRLARLIKRGG